MPGGEIRHCCCCRSSCYCDHRWEKAAQPPSLMGGGALPRRGELRHRYCSAAVVGGAVAPDLFTTPYAGWHARPDILDLLELPLSEDSIQPWMTIMEYAPVWTTISISKGSDKKAVAGSSASSVVGGAEQRAAEWGLVLKMDEGTRKAQGVDVCKSKDDASKGGQRDSRTSYWSWEDSETDVVREKTGQGCHRFLQGFGTDIEEIAKIHEALAAGTNYCGRLLSYKKDGTPFGTF